MKRTTVRRQPVPVSESESTFRTVAASPERERQISYGFISSSVGLWALFLAADK